MLQLDLLRCQFQHSCVVYVYSPSERLCVSTQIFFGVQVSHCNLHIRFKSNILPSDCDVADGVLCAYSMPVEQYDSP